jgi:hypothetical protein
MSREGFLMPSMKPASAVLSTKRHAAWAPSIVNAAVATPLFARPLFTALALKVAVEVRLRGVL